MEKQQDALSLWTDILEKQIQTNNELKLEDIENALAHISEEKDKGLFGLCNYYLAYYNVKCGRHDECLDYLNESIRCMVGTEQEKHVARCYNILGVIAHGQNNLLLAVEQYDKALDYAEKYGDHYMRNMITGNLADIYYRTGSYEKAFECYRESIQEYERSGESSVKGAYNYMTLLSGYGYCLVMNGEMKQARELSGKLYAMQTGKTAEQFPQLCAFTFFALLCYRENKMDLAENCLNVAIHAAINTKNASADFDWLINLFELLIIMKKYGHLGEVLDYVEPLAAIENNEGLLLQMLSYRLKYCGDKMTDTQYMESAKVFFRIKQEYEIREYGQILNMMEMRSRLHNVEEEQQLLEEQNTRLLYQADHDELSGLYNKGCLNRYAEETFEHAFRNQEMLGVLFVDIDYFKQMNDYYGHSKGDECIRAVADSIRECMDGDFAARYGGDEFVVITLGRDEEYIREHARRIVDNVREKQIENKNSHVADVLTVTVGAVCAVPVKHDKIWDFLSAADKTLYEQKKVKKGCMRFDNKVGGEQ